ncbi:MAG TPA: hypothetical protein VK796_13465 [Cytophaga sp.]|jgi:hypothetical protein|nr:hypothetical protein [Cytophaga sp.]
MYKKLPAALKSAAAFLYIELNCTLYLILSTLQIMRILSVLLFLFLAAFSSSAQTLKDFFGPAKYRVTWLGIDYSHVKIIGPIAEFGGQVPVTAAELQTQWYPAWNQLMVDEKEKFNLYKMLYRPNITYDLQMIKNINAASNIDSLEADKTPAYTEEQIKKFVADYPLENGFGFGAFFIVESMNKASDKAFYHIVIINMATKEVLIQARVQGNASGFGIRNFWAGSYYDAMGKIQKNIYPEWELKYGPPKPRPLSAY